MSAAVRAAIAAAASSVDGVSVSPYFTATTKAGSGMVRLDRMTRDTNGFGYVNTWQVVILLTQDTAAAEKFFEQKTPAIVAAVSAEMVVQTISPQELILPDNSRLPAVVIEGHRESD